MLPDEPPFTTWLNTSKLFEDPECVLNVRFLGRLLAVFEFDPVVPNLLKVVWLDLALSKLLNELNGLVLSKLAASGVFFTGFVKAYQFYEFRFCLGCRGGSCSTGLGYGALNSCCLGFHRPSLSKVMGSSSPGGANLLLIYFSMR